MMFFGAIAILVVYFWMGVCVFFWGGYMFLGAGLGEFIAHK